MSYEAADNVFFGYSGSDVTKIMHQAFRKASERAVKSPLFLSTVGSGTIYSPFTNTKEKQMYYATEAQCSQNNDALPVPDKRKIINFALLEEDVVQAKAEYTPTVRAETVIDLWNYRYHSLKPAQRP